MSSPLESSTADDQGQRHPAGGGGYGHDPWNAGGSAPSQAGLDRSPPQPGGRGFRSKTVPAGGTTSTNGLASSTSSDAPTAAPPYTFNDAVAASFEHPHSDDVQHPTTEDYDDPVTASSFASSSAATALLQFDPKKIDSVMVRMVAPEGWLIKHNVYAVEHEGKGTSVPRRYSDFVWLLDCLVKRYPFRLLPSLPPKGVAISGHHLTARDDSAFLERRRRGLQRFLTFLVNHPSLSTDPLVTTFLSEPSDLATWRTHHASSLHLVEEAVTRRLTPQEEMSIPQDLDDQLAGVRKRLPLVIEHWSRVCAAAERIQRRREAQAGDFTRVQVGLGSAIESDRPGSASTQIVVIGAQRPATPEPNWRLDELRKVEEEVEHVAHHVGRHAEILDSRARSFSLHTYEKLRAHRDLYSDFAALFSRYDRHAGDSVDKKLRPRVDQLVKKLEALREDPDRKPGWEEDAAKIMNQIEQDRNGIEQLLKRRVFIRYCLWVEWVFAMKWATVLGEAVKAFAVDERASAEREVANWKVLAEALQAE